MSKAITQGIQIEVHSEYRQDQSSPSARRYLFTYTVKISNNGGASAKLLSRHWIVTDGHGMKEEVVGDGVVGRQPHLETGEDFSYTSFCILKTPHGMMEGTYTMVRPDGTQFKATIAPFALVVPNTLN